MAEVKWIKIVTNVFENRKIKQIATMPEGDAIVLIWFKLLCLAGKTNDKGAIYFTANMPYTDQMLATEFNKPLPTVQLALSTFQRFGMIEIAEDNLIYISSWEEYQNIDGMEKIRAQGRERINRYREKKKLLAASNVSSNVTVTQSNALDIDKEEDIDIDKEKEKKKASSPSRHKYGSYSNVLLSDEELEKLKAEFPDWERRIERLSEYIASSGKKYKSHLATIRSWARKDKEAVKPPKPQIDESNTDFDVPGGF